MQLSEMLTLLDEIRRIPTLSGFEDRGMDAVAALLAPYFDTVGKAGVNSLLCTKKCGIEGAPSILIDAHLDEIGLIVSQIRDDGLLEVKTLGGMDKRTYTASRYVLHASEDLDAVSVKRSYLPDRNRKLPEPGSFWLFTGLSEEELRRRGVRVGTPVSAFRGTKRLEKEQHYGSYMDDKACAVVAVAAIDSLKDERTDHDLCLLLSSQEESFGAGFPTGAFAAAPEEILVVDVDLGHTPETEESKTVKMNDGPSVAISIQTDRNLTRALLRTAKECGIPVQPTMNVRSTGTNASSAPTLAGGIPAAVIGLPLKYMHTPVETLCEKDLENTAKLISAYLKKRCAGKGGAR